MREVGMGHTCDLLARGQIVNHEGRIIDFDTQFGQGWLEPFRIGIVVKYARCQQSAVGRYRGDLMGRKIVMPFLVVTPYANLAVDVDYGPTIRRASERVKAIFSLRSREFATHRAAGDFAQLS